MIIHQDIQDIEVYLLQLTDYVIEQLKAGYTKEQIARAVLESEPDRTYMDALALVEYVITTHRSAEQVAGARTFCWGLLWGLLSMGLVIGTWNLGLLAVVAAPAFFLMLAALRCLTKGFYRVATSSVSRGWTLQILLTLGTLTVLSGTAVALGFHFFVEV